MCAIMNDSEIKLRTASGKNSDSNRSIRERREIIESFNTTALTAKCNKRHCVEQHVRELSFHYSQLSRRHQRGYLSIRENLQIELLNLKNKNGRRNVSIHVKYVKS